MPYMDTIWAMQYNLNVPYICTQYVSSHPFNDFNVSTCSSHRDKNRRDMKNMLGKCVTWLLILSLADWNLVQDLTSYCQLLKLNLVYLHKWMSLLLCLSVCGGKRIYWHFVQKF